MTQEEKLEEAKRLYKTANQDQRYVLEKLFPELKESEDEQVRKEIIEFLQDCNAIDSGYLKKYCKTTIEKMITWLEKQGEQKPADLEEFINELSKQFPDVSFAKLSRIAVRTAKWAKPAWSEEDKKHIIDIIDYLDDYYSFAKDEYEDVADGVLNEIRWLQRIQERL